MNEKFGLNSMNIAELIHRITSAFPREDSSLPPIWADLSDTDRKLACDAIKTAYSEGIQDPKEYHNLWLNLKMDQGWTYGEKFSEELKTHPGLIPYEELSPSQVLKDQIWKSLLETFKEYYDEDADRILY